MSIKVLQKIYPIAVFLGIFLAVVIFQPQLSALPSEAGFSARLQQIQSLIEGGDLSLAGREIEELDGTPLAESYRASLQALSGNLAFRSGDYTVAIDNYRAAVPSLAGKDRDSLSLNLARAYLYRSRLPTGDKDDRNAALELFRSLLDSGNPAIVVRSRLELLTIGDGGIDVGDLRQRIDTLDNNGEKAVFLAKLAPYSSLPLDTFAEALKLAPDARTEIAVSFDRARWSLDNGLAPEALKSATRATALSASLGDDVISLKSRSLLARTFQALDRDGEAVKMYSLALDSIASVRRVYTGNRVPASVIDEIDSTIRAYLQITLESESPDLALAARLIRLSGLTEIDRYFRSICSPDFSGPTEKDARTAIVYTASLPESFHSIVFLPDGSYLHSRSPLKATEIVGLTGEWRADLADRFRERNRLSGKRFYDLILRPFEEQLQGNGIARLVFVNDRSLLKISMAALWNGKDYLISRYSVLYSTGLFGESGSRIATRPGRALLVSAYSGEGLPGTDEEIERLKSILNAGEVLKSDSLAELPRRLDDSRYGLLHIATHSTFGEGPRGAYLSLGDLSLTPQQFQTLLSSRNSDLSHLTLSSCYSARGDEYTSLGLSGIALRSGLRSVLGSLWPAADTETADFMTRFYRAWERSGDPAGALREAQLETIASGETRDRPLYWAGFVLVVN